MISIESWRQSTGGRGGQTWGGGGGIPVTEVWLVLRQAGALVLRNLVLWQLRLVAGLYWRRGFVLMEWSWRLVIIDWCWRLVLGWCEAGCCGVERWRGGSWVITVILCHGDCVLAMDLEMLPQRRRMSVALVTAPHSAVVWFVCGMNMHVLLTITGVSKPSVTSRNFTLERFFSCKNIFLKMNNWTLCLHSINSNIYIFASANEIFWLVVLNTWLS